MSKFELLLEFFKDTLKNIFTDKDKDLFLISEPGWAIKDDCLNISSQLKKQNLFNSTISITPIGIKNKIVHFASENTLIGRNGIKFPLLKKKNKIVLTWFHISENDQYRLKYIKPLNDYVDILHTSSTNTRNKLIANGFNKDKLKLIPLGVDTNIFHPVESISEKKFLRKKLGLPTDKIIIGSFQKDGNGWGEGLKPKMIKGPDIFCDAVEKLAQEFDIHVMLTGPARGYVKKRLEKAGISYTHKFFENYYEVAPYFRALDLYLVTSREEGGPKALLESMASGTPLISSKVGMVPDVIKNGENGFFVDIEDTASLLEKAQLILKNENLRNNIIKNGLYTVKNYDLSITIKKYYTDIYKPLLNK